MKILPFALFIGVSLAYISAWSNSTNQSAISRSSSGGGGGDPGLHQFTDFETETEIVTKPPYTVTGYTTYCPETTLLTITTCKHHRCAPTTITVTKPSTVIITDECLFSSPPGQSLGLHHHQPLTVTRTNEHTVTSLTTYCPGPTVFTYTRYEHHHRVPVTVTVTKATTITISETCIVAETVTELGPTPPTVALHNHHEGHHVVQGTVTRVVTRTVTDYITYFPAATVITVTECAHNVQTLSAVTVTEATTKTLLGTFAVPVTITEMIALTASPAEANAFAITVAESTVNELTTVVEEATVIIVTTCTTGKCAPCPITIHEATTLTLTGTLIVAETITERVPVTTTTEAPGNGLFGITVIESTVTELVTYVPKPTVLTVTTCFRDKRKTSHVTVHSATTLTVTGTFIFASTVTEQITETNGIPGNGLIGITIIESTVTELATIIAAPTLLTDTTCVGHACTPMTRSLTHTTTPTEYDSFVVTDTIPQRTASVGEIPDNGLFGIIGAESTLTGLTTFVPESTVLTLTPCVGDSCSPSLLTVSEATTLVLYGTFVTGSAVESGGATTSSAPSEFVNPTGTVPFTSVGVTGVASQAVSVPGNSELLTSTTPAFSLFQNSAARNFAGLVGLIGFAALLF